MTGYFEVDLDLYWEPSLLQKLKSQGEPINGQNKEGNVMCDNGDFFDDGIGAGELGIFLGISEELQQEEKAKRLEKENEPLTPEEMLETPFDYLDEEEL